ncbi:hypothetical protein [Verrucomicrobium spinosum]|uniref:hypothetical protein n=1 Tax=Verrucomicrobium spinosum TaxID=2736 RepID=UPI00094653B9|nr:hypothetical protein [Verrucomicrobium spinosum]
MKHRHIAFAGKQKAEALGPAGGLLEGAPRAAGWEEIGAGDGDVPGMVEVVPQGFVKGVLVEARAREQKRDVRAHLDATPR